MPANLTPDYLAAEARYKASKSVEEKLECLEEMLATVPKHKGTEKIQADIKGKIAKLRRAPRKKGASRRTDPAHVPREGPAQVVVLGAVNSGKSQLVATLTSADPKVAQYPFTTMAAQPAMMPYEDILLQLVDLPALGGESPVGWVSQTARYADAALVLMDLGAPDPTVQFRETVQALLERKVHLVSEKRQEDEGQQTGEIYLPTLLVATRMDGADAPGVLELVREEIQEPLEILAVSAITGEGLDELKTRIYELLQLVRVYSKERGKQPEKTPFVLRRGETVIDFAAQIHRDFVKNFKFAKVWGATAHDGQRVSRDYELQEGDIIEIHT